VQSTILCTKPFLRYRIVLNRKTCIVYISHFQSFYQVAKLFSTPEFCVVHDVYLIFSIHPRLAAKQLLNQNYYAETKFEIRIVCVIGRVQYCS